MVAVAGVIVVLGSLLAASVTVGNSRVREQSGHREDLSSLYVAEAGLSEAALELQIGLDGVIPPTAYGNSSYAVDATDLGGGLTSLVSTGTAGGESSRVEMVVKTAAAPVFQVGAFGDMDVLIDSNAKVDSYDSTLGSYALQATNGSGSNLWAHSKGDVGSNGPIVLSQNAMVQGDATPGPGNIVTIGSNVVLSGTQTAAASVVSMDPITLPTTASAGPLTVSAGTSHNLPSGNYRFDDTIVGKQAQLTIAGPASIVFGSFYMNAGGEIRVDPTNGPVDIYVVDDFVLNSNTTITSTTSDPSDIRFSLLSDNVIDPNLLVDLDIVDFNSNAVMYGTIYAPHAAIKINSNFELFGAIAAASLTLSSNAQVHFDETLLSTGPTTGEVLVTSVAWRLLAD